MGQILRAGLGTLLHLGTSETLKPPTGPQLHHKFPVAAGPVTSGWGLHPSMHSWKKKPARIHIKIFFNPKKVFRFCTHRGTTQDSLVRIKLSPFDWTQASKGRVLALVQEDSSALSYCPDSFIRPWGWTLCLKLHTFLAEAQEAFRMFLFSGRLKIMGGVESGCVWFDVRGDSDLHWKVFRAFSPTDLKM